MMIDLTSLGQFDFGTNWSFTPPPPGPSQIDLPETRWVVPPSKEATAAYIAQADPRTAIPLLEQMGYRKIDSTDQVMCTQDAMTCPDGTVVGRTGPNCEFAACPTGQFPGSWSEILPGGLPDWLPWILIGGGALWLLTRK